jgi:hypothetical protein
MDVEPFTLPHLRSLELYGKMTIIADVLLAVAAPSLESLVIAPFTTLNLKQFHDSLRRMSNLRQLQDTIAVTVVELDKWSILRQRSMFCDEGSMFYPWS